LQSLQSSEVDIRVRVPVDGAEGKGVAKSHESLSRQICLRRNVFLFVSRALRRNVFL
jgi:hypothetical protein